MSANKPLAWSTHLGLSHYTWLQVWIYFLSTLRELYTFFCLVECGEKNLHTTELRINVTAIKKPKVDLSARLTFKTNHDLF